MSRLLAAFTVFGLGSWIAVNGVYQQLPIIAQAAPEGYDIFSYATVAISLSNIVPALYIAVVFRLTAAKRAAADRVAIIGAVGVGGIAGCFLLSAYWDHTMTVPAFGDQSHSVLLIALIFAVGAIDCLTSLLFYPVLVGFPPPTVSALQLGETLTGLIAAVMAAIQTSCPGFGVSEFFQALAGLMALSMMGYCYLDHVRSAGLVEPQSAAAHSDLENSPVQGIEYGKEDRPRSSDSTEEAGGSECEVDDATVMLTRDRVGLETATAASGEADSHLEWKLLAAQAILAFIENGLHTTVLPYSLDVYPHTETLISVAVKLGYGLAALTTIFAHFKAPTLMNIRAWIALYTVSYMCGAWMLVSATLDIAPHSSASGVFTTIVVILCKAVVGFTKTSLFIGAKQLVDSERMLRFCGVGVQIGSLVGSILFFVLSVPLKCFHRS